MPVTKRWWFYDQLHDDWQDTGYDLGSAVFYLKKGLLEAEPLGQSDATGEGPPPLPPNPAVASPFEEKHENHASLKRDLDQGVISSDSFNIAMEMLRLQDEKGIWWQLGADGQSWLRWDGSKWVSDKPDQEPAFNQVYQPTKVSVPPKEDLVLHASESKSNSTLARFKLPLIILGALFGIFVFIAIIASLFDDSGPDIAPPDAGSSPGMTDMLTFNEPGYGFTMNYPREWSYGTDESGYVYFTGSQNTEENQITVIVDSLPSRSAGGMYESIEELYAEEIDYYYLLHGESFGYETSMEQIDGSQHKVVYGGGTFEHQGNLYSEIAIIIERDSSSYYIITCNAPESIFYKYQEKIVDVFISSFSFTN